MLLYRAIIGYSRRHREEDTPANPHTSQRAAAIASGTTQSALSELENCKTKSTLVVLMRYWRAIRLRVSLVFWHGSTIRRVFEVGAAVRPDSPGLAVAPTQGGTALAYLPTLWRGSDGAPLAKQDVRESVRVTVHRGVVRPVRHEADPALLAQLDETYRGRPYRGA